MDKKLIALKQEVELLREKIALLEKMKELQDAIGMAQLVCPQPIYVPVPYYPSCPGTPWHQPQITWTVSELPGYQNPALSEVTN